MLLRCRNAWTFFKLYYIHVNLCAFFLFLYSFIHNDNTQSTLKCGIHIFRRQNEINQYAATASAQIHFTNKKHTKRHTKTIQKRQCTRIFQCLMRAYTNFDWHDNTYDFFSSTCFFSHYIVRRTHIAKRKANHELANDLYALDHMFRSCLHVAIIDRFSQKHPIISPCHRFSTENVCINVVFMILIGLVFVAN